MDHQLVWIATAIVLVLGPVSLALAGLFSRNESSDARPAETAVLVRPGWPLVANSAMAYALAFNLIFFTQELFLVLPKALTPGLRPTLFHNNHTWSGDNPLAALWQGTGAVAIIVAGLICLAILPSLQRRSPVVRLLVIWLAYHGLIMGLAQIPVGALSTGSDVGMAMTYLGWSAATKTTVALLALAAIPLIAVHLTRRFLLLAPTAGDVGTTRLRQRFIFKAVSSAAFIGTLLVIPFRLPRELAEVIGPPIIVAIAGVSWIEAAAAHPALVRRRLTSGERAPSPAIRDAAWPLALALLVVFAFFHFVLSRGVRFY